MAESAHPELKHIEIAINHLEQALPQVIGESTHKEGIENVIVAANAMKEITFDQEMKPLAMTVKVLSSSASSGLKTTIYQSYLIEILEMLVSIKEDIMEDGPPKITESLNLRNVGEFLMRYADRVTNRYKINVIFESDYEAKAIRAFKHVDF
jgi:hypothetical protein